MQDTRGVGVLDSIRSSPLEIGNPHASSAVDVEVDKWKTVRVNPGTVRANKSQLHGRPRGQVDKHKHPESNNCTDVRKPPRPCTPKFPENRNDVIEMIDYRFEASVHTILLLFRASRA